MELLYGMDDGLSESSCARVKQLSKDAVLVGLCYRPPEHVKKVAKAFFRQLKKVLGSETLDFMGYFNLLTFSGRVTIWDATERFLNRFRDCLLAEVLNGPIRNDAKLDLLFTRKKWLAI